MRLLDFIFFFLFFLGFASSYNQFEDLSDQVKQLLTDTCEQHTNNRSDSSQCRRLLTEFPNHSESCYIVKYCDPCKLDSGFLKYSEFQYCTFNNRTAPTILMVIWLVILLICFATIADSFFGPCLIALARSLRMSQNLAGVTLLAFGNGAPDVFTAVTAILAGGKDDPDEGLGLGFLLGSGFLVNTLTAGLIILMKPFRMSRRPFLKDTIFYIIAVSWSASILIRRKMSLGDSIGFLCLYIVYVLTTWLAGIIRSKDPSSSTILRLMFRFFPCCFRQEKLEEQRENMAVQFSKEGNLNLRTNQDEPPASPLENGNIISRILFPHKKLGPCIELIGQRRRESTDQDLIKMIHQISHPKENKIEFGVPKINNNNKVSVSGGQIPMYREDGVILKVCPDTPQMCSKNSPHFAFELIEQNAETENPNELRSNNPNGMPKLRKRRKSRTSVVDNELPYLVRWIIAHEQDDDGESSGEDNYYRQRRMSGNQVNRTHSHISSTRLNALSTAPSVSSSRRELSPGRKNLGFEADLNEEDIRDTPPLEIKTSLDDILPNAKRNLERYPHKINNNNDILTMNQDYYDQEKSKSETSEDEVGIIGLETEEQLTKIETIQEWACMNMWNHFLYCLSPIEINTWFKKSYLMKIFCIIHSPLVLIFRLTIPIVLEELSDGEETCERTEFPQIVAEDASNMSVQNAIPKKRLSVVEEIELEDIIISTRQVLDEEAMHGWCKLLNCAHCIICPITWTMLIAKKGTPLATHDLAESDITLPIVTVPALVGFTVAIIVFLTSRWYTPPTMYHRPFFALMGFITSIIWIYCLAQELVNSLETLGIVWNISEAILGVSVMAFASSVGDIMSNTLLARNGYPRIAYSACTGAPLFNLLIGAGIPYTVKILRRDRADAAFSFTLTQAVLFALLLCVLVMNVIVALCSSWTLPRLYGALLILLYFSFVTVAVLIEADVIVSPPSWRLLTGVE